MFLVASATADGIRASVQHCDCWQSIAHITAQPHQRGARGCAHVYGLYMHVCLTLSVDVCGLCMSEMFSLLVVGTPGMSVASTWSTGVEQQQQCVLLVACSVGDGLDGGLFVFPSDQSSVALV